MARSLEQILDEYLVIQSQSGDRRSLDRLIERHESRVLRLAYARTNDRDGASEAAQEAWTHALRSLRRLKDPARFQAWLDQIVRFKCTDWIRARQRRRKTVELSEDSVAERGQTHDVSTDDRSAAIARLKQTLADLPKEQRLLLTRLYLDNRSVADIACELRVPVGTVKSRLYHAREQLRRAYERNEP